MGQIMADTNKILIADDNAANCELVEAYLVNVDCDVEIAVDGQDTLDKVASFKPDLILLDLLLPDGMGTDLLREVRGTASIEEIPVDQ